MAMLLPHELVLVMLVCILSCVNMEYTLYVRVHSYSNNDTCPTCTELNQTIPGCCDDWSEFGIVCTGENKCDPSFFYCLRKFGSIVSLNASSFESCGENDRTGKSSQQVDLQGGVIDFSQDHLLGLPNPVPLSGLTEGWQGVQLFVVVTDVDPEPPEELIDRFAINIDQIPIGNETTPTLYDGTFGFASLTLSFRVECEKFHYYPNCEENGCQEDGNCTCFPGYTGPGCEFDIDECIEASCPENTTCVDEQNSFSCLPQILTVHDCTGELCETPMPSQGCVEMDCNGNGVCNNATFSCNCSTGYSGEFCQQSNSTENSLLTYLLPVGLVSVIALIMAAVIICAVITNRLRIFYRQQEHIYEEVEGEKECFLPFHPFCLKVQPATRPPLPKKRSTLKMSGPLRQIQVPLHNITTTTHQLDTQPTNPLATVSKMLARNHILPPLPTIPNKGLCNDTKMHCFADKLDNTENNLDNTENNRYSQLHIYESIT